MLWSILLFLQTANVLEMNMHGRQFVNLVSAKPVGRSRAPEHGTEYLYGEYYEMNRSLKALGRILESLLLSSSKEIIIISF
jgi:hypothetical protein